MPFDKSEASKARDAGAMGGSLPNLPADIRQHRERFYNLLFRRALPLAGKFIIRCLKKGDNDDKRWATALVAKKTVPDAFTFQDPGGANTLVGLIQQAANAKIEAEKQKRFERGEEVEEKVSSLVKRPGASKSMRRVWAERKGKKKIPGGSDA